MLWNGLKRTNSSPIFSKYVHHGWRKFWISMLWNSLEQRNSTLYYFKVSSPWLKKILNFKALKWLRTNSISYYFLEVSLSRLKTNAKLCCFKMAESKQFQLLYLLNFFLRMFAIVEENFDVWCPELAQNELIKLLFSLDIRPQRKSRCRALFQNQRRGRALHLYWRTFQGLPFIVVLIEVSRVPLESISTCEEAPLNLRSIHGKGRPWNVN